MQKQYLKSAAAVLLCGAVMFCTGCTQKRVTLDSDAANSSQEISADSIVNYRRPHSGDPIVILTVKDYGDIKISLFPEESPKGVENFTKLVESGFYDELIFHRVIDGFVIQGGDPKGDGTGGVDAWGDQNGFEQTISNHLCHVTGAVAYAVNEQDKLNNSQFYIVTGQEINTSYFSQLRNLYGVSFAPQIENLYQQTGGQPTLDGGYEIFGQVFDGMEHCLAIQKAATDSKNKPKSAIVIEKAVVAAYDGAPPHWMNAAGEEIAVFTE